MGIWEEIALADVELYKEEQQLKKQHRRAQQAELGKFYEQQKLTKQQLEQQLN